MLIKKPESVSKAFNKEEILEEIITSIKETYPDYYILKKEEVNNAEKWDILIMRSLFYDVHQVIGMMNHEGVFRKRVQQIFAIGVVGTQTEVDALYEITRKEYWYHNFLIATNAKTIMQKLDFFHSSDKN